MPRHAKKIAQGNAAAEHLSAGVLALCFPMPAIQALLADCRALGQRKRDLPPEVMVFFVIAMSLFPDVGYQSVLRWLLNGLHWLGNHSFTLCVKSSLADARRRLGGAPLRRIYEHFAVPAGAAGPARQFLEEFPSGRLGRQHAGLARYAGQRAQIRPALQSKWRWSLAARPLCRPRGGGHPSHFPSRLGHLSRFGDHAGAQNHRPPEARHVVPGRSALPRL